MNWLESLPKPIRKLIKYSGFFGVLLFLWYVLFWAHFWPSWIFPSPSKVGLTLWHGLTQGDYIIGTLVSLRRLLIGFTLSTIVGSVIGFSIARNKHLNDTIGFLVLGLQTLPSICWLPLALLWFGLNDNAILFVVVMGSVLSTTIAVEGAIKSLPPLFVRAGTMLGATGFTLYRYVIWPAILPAFVTGLKHSWAFAWRSLMAGEMLFISAGLGQLLMVGREFNDMSQVLAVMIMIVIIGTLFDKLIFGILETNLRKKWGTHRS